jgi:hypothetical protein
MVVLFPVYSFQINSFEIQDSKFEIQDSKSYFPPESVYWFCFGFIGVNEQNQRTRARIYLPK